jgi:hypothetical protein
MIRDVAGHTQTSMTDRDMRLAAILRGGRFGRPFPEGPGALLRSGPGLDRLRRGRQRFSKSSCGVDVVQTSLRPGRCSGARLRGRFGQGGVDGTRTRTKQFPSAGRRRDIRRYVRDEPRLNPRLSHSDRESRRPREAPRLVHAAQDRRHTVPGCISIQRLDEQGLVVKGERAQA